MVGLKFSDFSENFSGLRIFADSTKPWKYFLPTDSSESLPTCLNKNLSAAQEIVRN
jgi:hypothetical protein